MNVQAGLALYWWQIFVVFASSMRRVKHTFWYSEVLIIRPSMVLVESGLNSEQVSLMSVIYIEKCILVLKQVVLIARVVLILSGLYSGILLYIKKWNVIISDHL